MYFLLLVRPGPPQAVLLPLSDRTDRRENPALRFPGKPLIIRVPFFLVFGVNKETPPN